MSNLIPADSPNFAPLISTSFAAFYKLNTLWLLFLVSVLRGGSVRSEVVSPYVYWRQTTHEETDGSNRLQAGGRAVRHSFDVNMRIPVACIVTIVTLLAP